MKQKFTLALLALLGISTLWIPSAHAEGLPRVKDFRIESKESDNKQAPILVLFMSQTCPYCETVLNDFLLPMQRDRTYNDKVILRQMESGSNTKLVDFDGKVTTQRAFASKHEVWAVPTVMLFDSQGHELTKIVGLLMVDYYLAYLDIAIEESQAKIKATFK